MFTVLCIGDAIAEVNGAFFRLLPGRVMYLPRQAASWAIARGLALLL